MGAYNIGITTVITTDATYIHESFSTVGFGTTENTKITASDGAASDLFGSSVAVGCGIIVVAAPEDDDNGTSSGSAYIFNLNGNLRRKITVSDNAAGDQFGYSVAVGSGRIVVGARFDDVGANTDQGSAYIYDLYGYEIAKITASDGAASDQFGVSVAAGSGRVVVGASNDISTQGSAYIFDLNGTQLAKITASDGASGNLFGSSVAVGNGRIVVGAPDVLGTGGAYIYDLNGTQLAKIVAFGSDNINSNRFGASVAVGCGKIVVGAYNIDGAYIYDLDGTQLAKITASDFANGDDFGNSVAVGSGRIVVGAYRNDITFSDQGSAYIFDLNGTQLERIVASNPTATDQFGRSVAVGSGRVVAGSPRDDDKGTDSGAAYIYNLPEDSNIYWERILDTYKY